MREVVVAEGTKLEQLLKLTDIVASGGEAKYAIQHGRVRINGKTEMRRGYRIKEGDVVGFRDETVRVSLQS